MTRKIAHTPGLAGRLVETANNSWAAYDLSGKEVGRGLSFQAAWRLLPPWPGSRDMGHLVSQEELSKLADIAKVPPKNRRNFDECILEIVQRTRSIYLIRMPRKFLDITKKVEHLLREARDLIVGDLDCGEYKVLDAALRMRMPSHNTGIRKCSYGGQGQCTKDCPLRVGTFSRDGQVVSFTDLIAVLKTTCVALSEVNDTNPNRKGTDRRSLDSVTNPALRLFVYSLFEVAEDYGGKLTFEKINGGSMGGALRLLAKYLPGFIPNEVRSIFSMIERVKRQKKDGLSPLSNPGRRPATSRIRNS